MSNFFAFISRMKYINRWGLMRSTVSENIQEHSHTVAIIAHALAVIANKNFSKNIDANRVAVIALYHDASEIITGDLPTPIKYYSQEIKEAYDKVEQIAKKRLVDMLPENMQDIFGEIIFAQGNDAELYKYVKAADVLSAYIKCIEECKAQKGEFDEARKSIYKKIKKLDMPEVDLFMQEFIKGFELSLDEQQS
ncbi:MAG: 5'-deoxynucleotidase [Ruminococcaceae bacterium]|nr:5'-deoxynucleotidase [Oscillospiraceae bacterium]